MSQQRPVAQPPGLNAQDILYVLFRHKWKILVIAAIGIGAAAVLFLRYPAVYESQAKLLVRYVVDRSGIDQIDSSAPSASLFNSQVEILTSWDLAIQVAKAIGAERLLPLSEGAADIAAAANSIRGGLDARSVGGSNIILVSYKNQDPELATLVLKEILTRYFARHLEIHRSADAFNFVSRQSDEVRARLNQTEDELRRLREEAGVTSLPESTANLNAELMKTREALRTAETEYAEQQALLQELQKPPPGQENNLKNAKTSAANLEVTQEYLSVIGRLASLRQTDLQLVSRYAEKLDQPFVIDEQERYRAVRPQTGQGARTAQNSSLMRFIGAEKDEAQALAREWYRRQNDSGFSYRARKKDFDTLVKEAEQSIIRKKLEKAQQYKASEDELARLTQVQKLNQMQIDSLEKQRSELEQKYPGLAAALPSASAEKALAEISAERARQVEIAKAEVRLVGIQARSEALKSQLRDILSQSQRLSAVEPQIVQLERKKEIEENNYKYFQSSLEKARIDEALDPSKMPNISVVQNPSIAVKSNRDVKKLVLRLAGGGIALGLGLAFLIELLLDRSVKRAVELEMLVGIPPLLSIPYLNGRRPLRLPWPSNEKSIIPSWKKGYLENEPWGANHFIRPYSEAIRDRLVLYFELHQMNHKPKLVAVTGCSDGAGTSTLAGGVAAALSETGDGKVLLVDMNVGRPEVHPFFRGAPACSLTEALVGEPAQAGENLYLATATRPDSQEAQLVPRKFYDLMPHLKASDFDYIIFDMPPFTQTSITVPMSRFMDKVVLVAEAEKSRKDIVKRASIELTAVGASIFVILNKVRFYAPKWLRAEA
jgi:uncharacterized protein involved in exopolysaccharide biosynthesis/Mrp family chromosome partitioning ATPase